MYALKSQSRFCTGNEVSRLNRPWLYLWERKMNLGELKNKILSDSAFQSEYENALDSGKLVDWAKSKGVDVSEEELVNALQ